ncbi:MAG: hypothetical protein M3P51_07370 [Chloroflexota bacterium]|nr:hypothetical protein [Chloroflexota bacterium]
MTQLDRCYQLLTEIRTEIAATLPSGRAWTLLALLRLGDTMSLVGEDTHAARPGWNLALRLCLEWQGNGDGTIPSGDAALADSAERFLADCDQLALADLALAQCVSGHLQLQQPAPGRFVAWATSRRLSTEQRERADFDWWSAGLARQISPRLAALLVKRPQILPLLGTTEHVSENPVAERYYRELGEVQIARFACQRSYPVDAPIGGTTFGQYTAILALLIGWLNRERDRHASDANYIPTPWDEGTLVAALAYALDTDPATVGHMLQPFILDRENAAYHSSLPGSAAPPLIRLDEGRVVLSAMGLLGEPLIFLARELRRRHGQEYHNSARLREGIFRQDLYRLFSDRRFVTSPGRTELKRSGQARTDLDALVFDRKTGALGVFELKAQDPFARSVEERQRQRDNFFHANRQVSAILEWVQRHGPDDLLARVDDRAAKRFRVQKVHVFVLGRYLAHFVGGPEPDRRASWGSWPQVLQRVEAGDLDPGGRNPLGTLFARLRDAPPPTASDSTNSQTISIGGFQLQIFPSFAEMRSEEGRPW